MNEITVNLTTRAFFRLSYPKFLILIEKRAATTVFENALLFGTFHLSTLLLYKGEQPTIISWQVLSPLPGRRGELYILSRKITVWLSTSTIAGLAPQHHQQLVLENAYTCSTNTSWEVPTLRRFKPPSE